MTLQLSKVMKNPLTKLSGLVSSPDLKGHTLNNISTAFVSEGPCNSIYYMRKGILIFLLILHIPLLVYSQYYKRCFKMDPETSGFVCVSNCSVSKDTTLILDMNSPISHFVISGNVVLENQNDSYVRVLLKDSYNYEYLVYENYGLLSDSPVSEIQNVAIESLYMADCVPRSITIEVYKATLQLTDCKCAVSSKSETEQQVKISSIRHEQTLAFVNKLNEQLEKRNMIWRAGITSLSELSYEEKKGVFGGKLPMLYGFDYFAGGIFTMPEEDNCSGIQNVARDINTASYVKEWDWRNRHGKNWLTPVKDQQNCPGCWVFAPVSLTEAYANLYYNRLVNLDLSEKEIMCCLSKDCQPGSVSNALYYIKNNGVVNEECLPFVTAPRDCSDKCDNPAEHIYIDDYAFFPPSYGADSLKKRLFKQPLTISLWDWNHSMLLSGYKTIHHGDTIFLGNEVPGNMGISNYIVIDSLQHQSFIGQTAWLMKDSWWGRGGMFYVIVDINNNKVGTIYGLSGRITSLQYDDSDIICEDSDGDGYYFWGIGDKPLSCPSWVPDIPDGDDSNNLKGALDAFGFLEDLADTIPTHTVSGNETFSTRFFHIGHIRIPSNCTLTVTNILNLIGSETIYIENGGSLVVDGGIISNAAIVMSSGGSLSMLNSGRILMRKESSFVAPAGTTVDMSSGEILPFGSY